MPYTGIVLAFLALHLALFLILMGHWLVSAGFFPRAVEKVAAVYAERPIRAALVGLITYGPIFTLLISAGKFGKAAFLPIFIGYLGFVVAFVGTSGLALLIGRNLSKDAPMWNQSLRGSVMLALVFITPFVGWGFLLHLGLASGFGAVLLAKPWKSAAPAPEALV